ncbi:MAG: 2Fe-2S iron-sulfur cluster-binding protein [Thermoplasmata archaeon]|nr:2Fe-2S iron-sulfur cluster-binding protein [Thermoplasmata archaeon]
MGSVTFREFTFDGTTVRSPPGTPVARALVRGRLPLLQRSIRYHRPRAPFCGVGSCTGCLVRVNGVPNVRACLYEPEPGDRVTTENAWPSPRFDVLGVIDTLFAHGLDTLHGFRRPRALTPLYHRVVRRLAGYGKLPRPTRPIPEPRGDRVDVPVAVIGAGRSGGAVAQRLREAGTIPLVFDRGPPGPSTDGPGGRPRTIVAFLPPPAGEGAGRFRFLAAQTGGLTTLVRAEKVVVATGGYDAGLLFAGNDRPGVVTGDGAIALTPLDGSPPFQRAVLFGGGPRAAELLHRFGEQVEAVVAPGPIDAAVAERASALAIPLYPRTLLLAARGHRQVRSVTLAPRSRGSTFSLGADAVLLAHRRLPNNPLLFQAGAAMRWRSSPGAYFPQVGPGGATSVPGLYACGEVAGASDPVTDAAAVSHQLLLGGAPSPPPTPSAASDGPPNELTGYYRELLGRPRGRAKVVACACEDVLLEEVEEASRRGFRGIEVVKRYTSLGTGLCQGRYCLPDALLILAQLEGRAPPEVGYIRQRPPAIPLSLGAIAALPDDPAEVET